MKTKFILIIAILFSTPSFGKHLYTLTKTDFITQFSEPNKSNHIYCTNEVGKKVWLYFNKNTQLSLKLNNDSNKIIMLNSIKYENKQIEASPYNVWFESNKRIKLNIDEVQSFTIIRNLGQGEYVLPYFNKDSCRIISKMKNDSLEKAYKINDKFIINLIAKEKSKVDTIQIIEDACYNITFKDNNYTEYGVVKRITNDSIYISNIFNKEMAKASKKEYKIFRYLIKDISELNLRKSGGFSFRNIKIDQFTICVQKINASNLNCPTWFAINSTSGEIHFYRSWFTERGYLGITETKGRAIWYEGEMTQ